MKTRSGVTKLPLLCKIVTGFKEWKQINKEKKKKKTKNPTLEEWWCDGTWPCSRRSWSCDVLNNLLTGHVVVIFCIFTRPVVSLGNLLWKCVFSVHLFLSDIHIFVVSHTGQERCSSDLQQHLETSDWHSDTDGGVPLYPAEYTLHVTKRVRKHFLHLEGADNWPPQYYASYHSCSSRTCATIPCCVCVYVWA